MASIAIIGPDGAGKTTVGRQLEQRLPIPVKYIYMGINLDSSNCLSPVSRLLRMLRRWRGVRPDTRGPRDPDLVEQRPQGWLRRMARGGKSMLGLVNRVTDAWYRQFLASYYQCRGFTVIFDRHYFCDYYAYDVAPSETRKSALRRIHGFILAYLYPKPNLVIFLDAPGDVLFERKGESTPELLERRRRDYLDMRRLFKHFKVVDATQSTEQVTNAVARQILDFCRPNARTDAAACGVRGER